MFMVLVFALATLGLSYGLWANSLTIEGTVDTGNVQVLIVGSFTDDDNKVDDPNLDAGDTGFCPFPDDGDDDDGEDDNGEDDNGKDDKGKYDEGDDDGEDDDGEDDDGEDDDREDEEPDGKRTSCDPAASGPDPKPHYDKDVAQCFANLADKDLEHEGEQNAEVKIENGYPSYFCTAWFRIRNSGSVPVKVRRFDITDDQGRVIVEAAQPGAIYELDLSGPEGVPDGKPDLDLHITDIELKQQIDPTEEALMDLDMHIRQEAPQEKAFAFELLIELAQWNEVE